MTTPVTHCIPLAPYRLEVAGLREALAITSFHGEETISQPFSFTLQMHGELPGLEPAQLMYRLAFLHLGDNQAGFHGQIQGVECTDYRPGLRRYRLTLGPRLACLAQRYTPRVFQHLSSIEIIAQVLSEHGIEEGDFRFHLKSPCRTRRFCAQYLENDLQLIQRLCAEEHIHYHFTHSPQGHQLIFGCGLFGSRRSPAASWCETGEGSGVSFFNVCQTDALIDNLADKQLQGVAQGRSSLPSLGCGQLLPLTGHPQLHWNRLWRMIRVEHHGDEAYHNRFVARSWDAPIEVPAASAVAMPVVMRAWVVGTVGQPVEPDAGGRVRVQFEWVLQGNGARFADCWLPVQAGVKRPLLGAMEVLVSPARDPDGEPQVVACLDAPAQAAGQTQPGPMQARLEAAWLMGEDTTLQLSGGLQLQLSPGAKLTVQVEDCRVHLDATGLALSAPSLAFGQLAGEPAIVAAETPGDETQVQPAQQCEQQEGQP